jgi:uncharacterized membrane protein YhiD involved in acid resistance
MTPEVITATAGLGQYGAIGVAVLSMIGIVAVVLATFKFNANQSELNRKAIAEQSNLNREAHKENTTVMTGALREVSTVVGKFARENREDHIKMAGVDKTILNELREIKAKVK